MAKVYQPAFERLTNFKPPAVPGVSDLTLFAEEQVWDKGVDLGQNIKSLWTGTSCISTVPGRIYHKPVNTCTKEEFIEEVRSVCRGRVST